MGILLNLMNICKLPAGSVYKVVLFVGNTGVAQESPSLHFYWIWFPKSSCYAKRHDFMCSVTNCNLRTLLLHIRFNKRNKRKCTTLPVYRKCLYYLTQMLTDTEPKTQTKKFIFICETSTAIFQSVFSLKCL